MKLAIFTLIILVSCFGTIIAEESELPGFDDLCEWMTGSFSSTQQAARDSDFADITLEMHQIWPDREDGYWLYVQQEITGQGDKIFRQRIANLVKVNDTTFRSVAYAIPEAERFLHNWEDSTLNQLLTPDSLIMKDGCEVIIWPTNKIMFSGSTIGHNCPINFKGSVYSTSELTISPKMIFSWDRGYDADGKQVWGSQKGGYTFRRIE